MAAWNAAPDMVPCTPVSLMDIEDMTYTQASPASAMRLLGADEKMMKLQPPPDGRLQPQALLLPCGPAAEATGRPWDTIAVVDAEQGILLGSGHPASAMHGSQGDQLTLEGPGGAPVGQPQQHQSGHADEAGGYESDEETVCEDQAGIWRGGTLRAGSQSRQPVTASAGAAVWDSDDAWMLPTQVQQEQLLRQPASSAVSQPTASMREGLASAGVARQRAALLQCGSLAERSLLEAEEDAEEDQDEGMEAAQTLQGPQTATLLGEECGAHFWDRGLDVHEVFPFQRPAVEFADWCNVVSPAVVRDLQREAARINFPSFAARWKWVAAWMERHAPLAAPGEASAPAAAPAAGHGAGEEEAHSCQQHAGPGGGVGPPRAKESVRAFVREYRGREGYTRNFVATTYKALWRRYQQLPSLQRHYYEIIRSDRPCHMYFDIEYSRGVNAGANGDALVATLVERLGTLLWSTWRIALQPAHVMELESVTEAEAAAAAAAAHRSSQQQQHPVAGDACLTAGPLEDKFSRHLVVRLPGVALANNGVAGAIVARLGPELQAAGLCLLKAGEASGGATASIVDPAVYSRGRHFRMIWSCKGGKQSVLRPTARYLSASVTNPLRPHQQFMASLICNVHPEAQLLTVPPGFLDGVTVPKPTLTALRGGAGPVGRYAADGDDTTITHPTTRRPMKMTWAAEPQELQALPLQAQAQGQGQQAGAVDSGNPCCRDGTGAATSRGGGSGGSGGGGGSGRSALQQLALDAVPFVEAIGTGRAFGAEAQVRSIAYCGEGASVSYGMIGPGSHWCERISRCHRSNHVYFLLDFLRGRYCQKCYDPDCSGWRSPWSALPMEAWQRGGVPIVAIQGAAEPDAAAGGTAAVSQPAQGGCRQGASEGHRADMHCSGAYPAACSNGSTSLAYPGAEQPAGPPPNAAAGVPTARQGDSGALQKENVWGGTAGAGAQAGEAHGSGPQAPLQVSCQARGLQAETGGLPSSLPYGKQSLPYQVNGQQVRGPDLHRGNQTVPSMSNTGAAAQPGQRRRDRGVRVEDLWNGALR